MKKMFGVLWILIILTGCVQEDVTLINLCEGTWVRVSDGESDVRIPRLDFGQRGYIGLSGQSRGYNRMVLVADFYQLSDGKFVGTVNRRFSPRSGTSTGLQETAWDLKCPR